MERGRVRMEVLDVERWVRMVRVIINLNIFESIMDLVIMTSFMFIEMVCGFLS